MGNRNLDSIVSTVEPGSIARLDLEGEGGAFTPTGAIYFSGGYCSSPPCPIYFDGFDLGSSTAFGVKDHSVTAVTVRARTAFQGSVDAAGYITIPAASPFDAVSAIDGHFISREATPAYLSGTLDRANGILHLQGQLAFDNGSASFDVAAHVTDAPPVIRVDGDFTAECGLPPNLSAAASFDPDGDAIVRYIWSELVNGAKVALTEGPELTVPFQRGDHDVEIDLYDARGRVSQALVHLKVVDTLPPAIESMAEVPACLWPANHLYYPYRLGKNLQVIANDACDPTPIVHFTSVSSDQPDNGTGDGDTANDVVMNRERACIRSERAGNIIGPRVYTFVITAVDNLGNTTTASTAVTVGHDQSEPPCPELPSSSFAVDGDERCSPKALESDTTSGVSRPSEVLPVEGAAGCSSSGDGTGSEAILFGLAGLLLSRRTKHAGGR